MASHYRSNLRDLEFNLFEVNRIQDYLGSGPWPDVDEATARDILLEIERLAREDFAASYVDQDRIPLVLEDGEVHLPDSVKAGVRAYKEGGWDRFAVPADMGRHQHVGKIPERALGGQRFFGECIEARSHDAAFG